MEIVKIVPNMVGRTKTFAYTFDGGSKKIEVVITVIGGAVTETTCTCGDERCEHKGLAWRRYRDDMQQRHS